MPIKRPLSRLEGGQGSLQILWLSAQRLLTSRAGSAAPPRRRHCPAEVFPARPGVAALGPLMLFQGVHSSPLLVWFSAQPLVQTLRDTDISPPSSFEKRDSFQAANLSHSLGQISKTLIALRRGFKMTLIHVLIQLVIF